MVVYILLYCCTIYEVFFGVMALSLTNTTSDKGLLHLVANHKLPFYSPRSRQPLPTSSP